MITFHVLEATSRGEPCAEPPTQIPAWRALDVPAVKMQRPQLARLVNTVKALLQLARALGLNKKVRS